MEEMQREVDTQLTILGKKIAAFRSWASSKKGESRWVPIIRRIRLQITGGFAFFSALCAYKLIQRFEEDGKQKEPSFCMMYQESKLLCCIHNCPRIQEELKKVQKKYKI